MTNEQNAALTALIKQATAQLDTSSSYMGMINSAILHNARRAIIELAIEQPTPKKQVTRKQARRFDFMKFAGKLDNRNKKLNLGVVIKEGKAIASSLDQWVTFKTDHETGNFKLKGTIFLKNETIHELPECPDMGEHVASVTMTRETLQGIAIASSKDETRRVLLGVCIGEEAGKFYCVGTDGRRLHLFERPGREDVKWEAIIPTQAIKDLLELFEDEVTLEVKKNGYLWAGGAGGGYVSKLIDGVYPNFRQVIPADQGHSVEFNKAQLIEQLKEVILPYYKATEKKYAMRLSLSLDTITCAMDGEKGFSIPCKSTEVLSACYNVEYLIDMLIASPDNSVMWFEDNYSPITLRGGDFKAVLMPLRVS